MSDPRLDAFGRLLNIMDELREQCPWDRKQTMESLRHLSIEEVYELSEAILQGDMQEVKKELGDVLLHIVFYARIASETNDFTIKEVIDSLCEKLIQRHPHIYGNVQVKDEEEVKQNWEQIKLKESEGKKRLLSGVPTSLASLVKAYRMQEKAAQVGFDWPNKKQVWAKVEEEIGELTEASGQEHREEEFGDLLFALVNYARFEGINPDDALEKANLKFRRRFDYIEEQAIRSNQPLRELGLQKMDEWWNEAKQLEK